MQALLTGTRLQVDLGDTSMLANLSINHREFMGYHGHIMGILPGIIDVESGCWPSRLIWLVREFSSKTDRTIGESQDQQGIQFPTNQMMGFSSQLCLPTVGYLKQQDEKNKVGPLIIAMGRGNTWYPRWLIHMAMEAAHGIEFLRWLSKLCHSYVKSADGIWFVWVITGESCL